MRLFAALIFISHLLAGTINGAPVTAQETDFGAWTVSLDFLGLLPGTPVLDTFSSSGVEFAPGLFAAAELSTVTNYYSFLPVLPLEAAFSINPIRVGFLVRGGDGDRLTLTGYDNWGNLSGSVDFFIGSSYSFAGISDSAGIQRLLIDNISFGDGTLHIQQFRFEPVPEPAVTWFTGAGLAALSLAGRWLKGISHVH
ncbi:MAG: hypothetical protein HY821_08885 [Acidobacteria bacterium]|nr:hypothetical protein [Acidobacteriota bacterium]